MHSSEIRKRSRSARERSTSLRLTSKELRDSLEALRAHGFKTDPSLPEQGTYLPLGAPDFAGSILQRVYKARHEAQTLRRRATDLRHQAAAFRARAENLRSDQGTI